MSKAEERLREEIEAYHASALVYAAVKLGLPERMGERRWNAEQLAKELRLSPPHLLRFLRGLAAIGICEEVADGRFALTELGGSLRHGSPSRLAEKVEIVVGQYWRPWAELAHTLATGEPAFEQVFGTDIWDWRARHAAHGDAFNAYMAGETLSQSGAIVAALDLAGVTTIADIGGGHGGLIAAILNARPGLRGILFDLPETLVGAKTFLRSQGVEGRVALVGGDILAEIPVAADLYVLKSVLQHWDDAGARAILESCREAMAPSARLAVIERLLPERAADDPGAVMLDLHMMTITGGKARTLAEFEALLSQAPFLLARVSPTRAGLTIIEARPV
jgi:SAM-dependent methyltransferase